MKAEVSDLARTESEKGLASERAPGKPGAPDHSGGKRKRDVDFQTGFQLRSLYNDVLDGSFSERFLDLLSQLEKNPKSVALNSEAVLPSQLNDFDLAVARLSQLSDTLNELAEESRRDIVLMSVKRQQLDRLISDNDLRLRKLMEHT
jgi:hypothetical protein